MGRTKSEGISFYRMNSRHILNKKVRLLCNEFDSDGYFIWSCLLDYGYDHNGYYFDTNDRDEMELFASEYCKKKLPLIQEVINGCIRRDLFDKRVADMFGILTSDMMQDTFLKATADRRGKGTSFDMIEDFLLIQIPEEIKNISLVPWKIGIVPPNNPVSPPNNTQRRVEKSREDQNRKENVAPATPAPPKRVVKPRKEEPPEPHWQKLVDTWFAFCKEKFTGVEPSFARDDPKIFKRIIALLKKRAEKNKAPWTEITAPQRLRLFLDSAFADDWLSKHFLLANIEKQFDTIIRNQVAGKTPSALTSGAPVDVDYLYERFCDGQLDRRLVLPEHYHALVDNGTIHPEAAAGMISMRIHQLMGTNQASELRLMCAYQEGKETAETKADAGTLKRMAVLEYFKWKKENAHGKQTTAA